MYFPIGKQRKPLCVAASSTEEQRRRSESSGNSASSVDEFSSLPADRRRHPKQTQPPKSTHDRKHSLMAPFVADCRTRSRMQPTTSRKRRPSTKLLESNGRLDCAHFSRMSPALGRGKLTVLASCLVWPPSVVLADTVHQFLLLPPAQKNKNFNSIFHTRCEGSHIRRFFVFVRSLSPRTGDCTEKCQTVFSPARCFLSLRHT